MEEGEDLNGRREGMKWRKGKLGGIKWKKGRLGAIKWKKGDQIGRTNGGFKEEE